MVNYCKIKYTSIVHGMFYKLVSSNSWLFLVTQQRLIFICYNRDAVVEILTGSGILSLSAQCSAISEGYRLIPFKTMYSELESDIIHYLYIIQYTREIFNTIKEHALFETIFSNYNGEIRGISSKNNLNKKFPTTLYNGNLIMCSIIVCILMFIVLLGFIVRQIVSNCKSIEIIVNNNYLLPDYFRRIRPR